MSLKYMQTFHMHIRATRQILELQVCNSAFVARYIHPDLYVSQTHTNWFQNWGMLLGFTLQFVQAKKALTFVHD